MQTKILSPVHPSVLDKKTAPQPIARQQSAELGADLRRLEHEAQIALDRERQEALARLREIQAFD